MLLQEGSPLTWPACIAQSIMVLEQHNNNTDDNDIDSVMQSRVICSKNRDLDSLLSSISRDALKFYRKRISCKCLKTMHLEARKTIPKMGICGHCKHEMERVSLSVCSRCMIYHYCSRECQVAAWPNHKSQCDNYVNVKFRQVDWPQAYRYTNA